MQTYARTHDQPATHPDETPQRPAYRRRRGVHDLPRHERRGGRADQVRAAVAARV